MIKYYYPNYFLLKEDVNNIYLFFDIIIKNNELILIVPIYENFIIEINKLKIYLKDELKIKEIIKYEEYEPVIILKYNLSYFDEINNVKIIYDKIEKEYQVMLNFMEEYNILNNKICISTLFKDDYYLLNTWIKYYEKQGILDFYLYYNDKINIKKIKIDDDKLNITLIEWKFHYWNKSSNYKHHAQIGMLNHCLYNYSNNFNYWLNIDLDEYVHNLNYIDFNKNIDIYLLNNRWGKLENDIDIKIFFKNVQNLYNLKFYLGDIYSISKKDITFDLNLLLNKYKNKIYLIINRTKWIINTGKFKAVSIHLPKLEYNLDYIINYNYWFSHFSNWSNSNIRRHFFKDNYKLDYHFLKEK